MDKQPQVLLGSLAADAVAMPVHWYYDRDALKRDYGHISGYLSPKNPHPDSILWRSAYTPLNAKGEILHDQAAHWGQRGVHYHQFLQKGENTLNFKLSRLLYDQVRTRGQYDADAWLDTYIEFMLAPGRHSNTYLEEYHRHFFTNYARGKKPRTCGCKDVHIGGLAMVSALFDALDVDPKCHALACAGACRPDASGQRCVAGGGRFCSHSSRHPRGKAVARCYFGRSAGLDFGSQDFSVDQ